MSSLNTSPIIFETGSLIKVMVVWLITKHQGCSYLDRGHTSLCLAFWLGCWCVLSDLLYTCSKHFTNRDVFAAQSFNSFHNVVSFLGWPSQIIISTWIHSKIYNFRYSYKNDKHIHFENLEHNFQKLLNAGHCHVENLLRQGLNFWICFKSYLGNSTIIFVRLTN